MVTVVPVGTLEAVQYPLLIPVRSPGTHFVTSELAYDPSVTVTVMSLMPHDPPTKSSKTIVLPTRPRFEAAVMPNDSVTPQAAVQSTSASGKIPRARREGVVETLAKTRDKGI